MYTTHFHLRAEPFALTPDPDFLYLSPDHREALAAIQYGLLDGRGFMTLIGEVGTGKTTLLYSLLGRLGPDIESAYVAYTTRSFEDLLASAMRDLGVEVPGGSKSALLDAFNAKLLRNADQGRTTALVIDEAQNLSDEAFEELRLLSNFESYNRKLLQIVLVGQPELQDRLSQWKLRQVKERVAVRACINPMPAAEMRRYLEFRLQRAGAPATALFDSRALRLIIARARGIPRRANILCHNSLLFAYGRGLPQVTARIAREAIAEMDERRPGLLGGSAVRRAATRMAIGRWAAKFAVAVVLGVAIGRLMPRFAWERPAKSADRPRVMQRTASLVPEARVIAPPAAAPIAPLASTEHAAPQGPESLP